MVEALRYGHIIVWSLMMMINSLSWVRNLLGYRRGRDRLRAAVFFVALAFTFAGVRALIFAPPESELAADAAAAWVGMYVLTILAAPILLGATWLDSDDA